MFFKGITSLGDDVLVMWYVNNSKTLPIIELVSLIMCL